MDRLARCASGSDAKSGLPRRSYLPRNLTCGGLSSTTLRAMSLVRLALGAASLALLVMASWATPPSAGETLKNTRQVSSPSPVPSSSPVFQPGPNSVSGRVVRLTAGGAVLTSAAQDIEVSFSRIIDVWRETSVAPTAIEVGDDLFVNGTNGSPFMAAHISANIGRIDGIILEIDDVGMLVEVPLRSGGTKMQRIDFSPYIEYGYTGGPKLTRADLGVGRTIGVVIYRSPEGSPRATRVW